MNMRRATKEKKSSAARGLPRLQPANGVASEPQQMNMRRATKGNK